MESIRLTTTLLADPLEVYRAWLSGARHTAMTGGAATSEQRKGGVFTAWDGYISGKHLELEPGARILQTWRTIEFPGGAPDSRLEIRLAKVAQGTRLTLLQSGIPDGQGEMYSDGWQEHYFAPMSRYFPAAATPRVAKTKKKAGKSARTKPAKTKPAKTKPAKTKAPKARATKTKAPKARAAKTEAPKTKPAKSTSKAKSGRTETSKAKASTASRGGGKKSGARR
jgi:uncharacterized protein YndB with AHSA1/START domain